MNIEDVSIIINKIFSFTIIKILLVIILTLTLNNFIKSIVNKIFRPKKEIKVRNEQLVLKSRETANKIIFTIIKITVWITAILIIFSLLNININSFLAGAGFFGLIIGLGTRTYIESLVSGFFLIADGNISIGDFVRVGEVSGIVKDIGVRNITIQTNTGEISIIPVLHIKGITNYSIDTDNLLVNLSIPTNYDFMKIMNTINNSIKDMSEYIDTTSNLYISGFNIYKDNYEIRIACMAVEGTNIHLQSIIKNELIRYLNDQDILISD